MEWLEMLQMVGLLWGLRGRAPLRTVSARREKQLSAPYASIGKSPVVCQAVFSSFG